jgi:hypothetical protein
MPFNKMHALAFCAFLAVSAFSLRAVFATGDPLAFHDLAPMYRLDQLYRPYDFPWDYKSNLGTPSLLTGNAVYNVPLIALSSLFGSVSFAHKVLFVLFAALSGFGFYAVFAYLLKSKTAGVVAGLYMMFNPFTLTRWEFGHNTVLMAYAILPFAVFAFFKTMNEGSRMSIFVCGLLTAFMIYASPQVAYMFVLFAFMYAFFDVAFSGRTGAVRRLMARGGQVGLILAVALVAAFPFFYQLIMVNLPVYSTRAEEASTAVIPQPFVAGVLYPQMTLAFLVIFAFLFLWWKSGFTKLYRWWKADSAGESSSLLITASRQLVASFALVGFLSILVVVLVFPPFTPAYNWLFNNVPGFGMFREVDKFFMLSAFSAAFFLGVAAEGIKRFLAKRSSILRKTLPVLLITLLVFASSWQFLTGDVNGIVGTVQIPEAYQQFDSWLASQNGDFRIAFFPPAVWATTYSWASRWFLDPVVALQVKPTVEIRSESDLTKGASLSRWIYTAIYSNRTSDWGKLLSVLGVKYVIVRLDADMPSVRVDLATFSMQRTIAAWGEQKSLRLVKNFTSILVYENINYIPKIYQTNGLSLVAGDRGTLLSIVNLNLNLTQNPPAFLEDNIGLTKSMLNDSEYIFLQGDSYWSMLVSSLGESHFVKLWEYAHFSANPLDKWVSGDLMWYFHNGDPNVAPDGFIYTEGTNSIIVPLGVEKADSYRVLAQVYDGLPNSKGMKFAIGNYFDLTFKPSRSTEGSYRWIDLGSLNLDPHSELQISGLGGPAAISKLAVVPENDVGKAAQNVSALLQGSEVKVVYLFDDRAWSYNPNALVVEPEANYGRVIALSNSSVEASFHVFNEGTYWLTLTFQNPAKDVPVRVHVDNILKNLKLTRGAGGFSTEIEIGPLDLTRGWHSISVEAEAGDARFNMARLTNYANGAEEQFHNSIGSEVASYSMRSGSEYLVDATASYVAFLEAGNSYWKLDGDSEAAAPICIFNYGSLFPVNNPGGRYTLRYLGLGYIEQGFLVAVVGTVLMGLALKFLHRKPHDKEKRQR